MTIIPNQGLLSSPAPADRETHFIIAGRAVYYTRKCIYIYTHNIENAADAAADWPENLDGQRTFRRDYVAFQ